MVVEMVEKKRGKGGGGEDKLDTKSPFILDRNTSGGWRREINRKAVDKSEWKAGHE